jgi:hypothetical protein
MDTLETLYTRVDLAGYFGIETDTLDAWIRDGYFLPADIKRGGRYSRWTAGRVREGIALMVKQSTPPVKRTRKRTAAKRK